MLYHMVIACDFQRHRENSIILVHANDDYKLIRKPVAARKCGPRKNPEGRIVLSFSVSKELPMQQEELVGFENHVEVFTAWNNADICV